MKTHNANAPTWTIANKTKSSSGKNRVVKHNLELRQERDPSSDQYPACVPVRTEGTKKGEVAVIAAKLDKIFEDTVGFLEQNNIVLGEQLAEPTTGEAVPGEGSVNASKKTVSIPSGQTPLVVKNCGKDANIIKRNKSRRRPILVRHLVDKIDHANIIQVLSTTEIHIPATERKQAGRQVDASIPATTRGLARKSWESQPRPWCNPLAEKSGLLSPTGRCRLLLRDGGVHEGVRGSFQDLELRKVGQVGNDVDLIRTVDPRILDLEQGVKLPAALEEQVTTRTVAAKAASGVQQAVFVELVLYRLP